MGNGKPGEDTRKRSRLRTPDLAYIALFAAVITLCAWVTVPSAVPFTLQTFGVFCAVGLLGGKRGVLSVLLYLLLGCVGAPVFSGFSGGFGVMIGPTGGYLIGFVFTALVMWLLLSSAGDKQILLPISMLLGLLACYTFGTAWFVAVYTAANGPVTLGAALSWCVLPFLVPDLVKLALAYLVVRKLKPRLKLG